MMGLLRNAVAALPQLVETAGNGPSSSSPIEALMSRAFAFADGRDPEQQKQVSRRGPGRVRCKQRDDELGSRLGRGSKAGHGSVAA